MINKIRRYVKECEDLWKDIQDEYGFKDIPLIFVSVFDDRAKDLGKNSIMTSGFIALVEDLNLPDEDTIVEGLKTEVYVTLEQFYLILIEHELDFDETLEYIRICLRHEMGHIIDMNKRFVGKRYTDWINNLKEVEENYDSLPEIKYESSNEYLFDRFIKFFELPDEKRANDAVGITKEDIKYLWKDSI